MPYIFYCIHIKDSIYLGILSHWCVLRCWASCLIVPVAYCIRYMYLISCGRDRHACLVRADLVQCCVPVAAE